MTVIGLFFPAFISMAVCRRLSRKTSEGWLSSVVRFGIYVLVGTWFTQVTLTSLLGLGQVVESALTSFPFFTKYVVIASIWAVILPIAEEMIKKYIKVSIHISSDEKKI